MKKAKTIVRYESAAKTFTDEDARIIGPALQKIADANQVGDVRSLDKQMVFDAVEADPKHPLRRFYNWDDAACARKQRLARTLEMIRSVRIVIVTMGKRGRPTPQFLYVPESERRRSGVKEKKATRRRNVLSNDLLGSQSPEFMSMLSAKIRAIEDLTKALAHVALLNKATPPEVKALVNELTGALHKYLNSRAAQSAAA